MRNRDQPQWFDHRYRFKPHGWGPAETASPALAVTGACMYVRREAIERIGAFDERYAMAYEDVDWCLRAWQAGLRVLYFPSAQLVHHESVTRGTALGEREAESQRLFWERWSDFFDARETRVQPPAGDGSGAPGAAARGEGSGAAARAPLRIVYVTEDTGVGGGHRDIFEHLNRLSARGHDVALYTLGEPPDWFELRAPVHSFEDYTALGEALAELDAIKVATWWMTAAPVWRASIPRGMPVYFVQDIETSYYPDDERARHAVIDSYRPEFRYMTISSWNRERLRELDLDAELIPPGIDLQNFRPRPEIARREDMVLAIGRTNPLKNLPLTLAGWRALSRAAARAVPVRHRAGARAGRRALRRLAQRRAGQRAVLRSDRVRADLRRTRASRCRRWRRWRRARRCVCTDAHGNRDFCIDGVNCLMPEASPAAVAAALQRLLGDPELRAQLGRAGIETAQEYAWERRIDALEAFFERVAASRRMAVGGELAPGGDGAR